MFANRSASILFLVATIVAVRAEAKKPDKPGGNGRPTPVATGVIYFGTSSGFAGIAADGSQIVPLPREMSGQPSHQLHSGFRWFLQSRDSAVSQRLYAIREDGNVVARLTDDPSLRVLYDHCWVNTEMTADAAAAFVADRLDMDPESATYGETLGRAVYVVVLKFDGNGVPTPVSPPTLLVEEAVDFHFSPDGSLLAYTDGGVLFILDLVTGQTSIVFTVGDDPQQPQFSPNGLRIAYKSFADNGDRILTGLHVAELSFDEASGYFFIASEQQVAHERIRLKGSLGGSGILSGPYWSPDGTFLTYAVETWAGYEIDYSLMRIRDDGSNPTNLIPDDGQTSWLEVWGWR